MNAPSAVAVSTLALPLKQRLDTALLEITHAELVRPLPETFGLDQHAYLFKHALVQDTTMSTLLRGDYRRLNLLVAQAYEKLFSERDKDELASILAQHYASAGDNSKTVEYATRAGDLARRLYANPEAIAHYTLAIQAARELNADDALLRSLYEKRGRAYELMSNHTAALENYAELEALGRARGDRAMELAGGMARATLLSTPNPRFDPALAHPLNEQNLALARELEDEASEARILWTMLLVAHFEGRLQDGIAAGEQSIALARKLNLTERLAYALNDIGRPYMMAGEIEKGIASMTEAHELWRQLDNQPMLADNLNTLATNSFNLGDYDRAIALATEAYAIGELINNRWTQTHSLMTRSFIYADRGEVERSIQTMEKCLDLALDVGFLVAISSISSVLALTYGMLGDVPRGLKIIESDKVAAKTSGRWQVALLAIRAQLYLLNGDIAQARALVEASLNNPQRETPTPYQIGSNFLAATELALAEGDYPAALENSDKLLKLVGSGVRFYRLYAYYLRACALDKLGRTDEAVTILHHIRADGESNQARRTLWRILALLGEIETRRENHAAAAALNAEARDVLNFILTNIPAEYRESFANHPEVRAVLETV